MAYLKKLILLNLTLLLVLLFSMKLATARVHLWNPKTNERLLNVTDDVPQGHNFVHGP